MAHTKLIFICLFHLLQWPKYSFKRTTLIYECTSHGRQTRDACDAFDKFNRKLRVQEMGLALKDTYIHKQRHVNWNILRCFSSARTRMKQKVTSQRTKKKTVKTFICLHWLLILYFRAETQFYTIIDIFFVGKAMSHETETYAWMAGREHNACVVPLKKRAHSGVTDHVHVSS